MLKIKILTDLLSGEDFLCSQNGSLLLCSHIMEENTVLHASISDTNIILESSKLMNLIMSQRPTFIYYCSKD